MKKLISVLLAALLLLALAPSAALAESPDDNCRHMLINKSHMLAADYAPSSLVPLASYIPAGGSVMMTEEAALALKDMVTAMRADGIYDIYGQSGYRSYSTQEYLYDRKIAQYRAQGYEDGEARRLAAQIVAPPGASEHQSGLAIDFVTGSAGLNESFAYTAAGKWLAENSWRYGYILRYPKGKESITGYVYEPWHFRYVGQAHAEYIYRHNITLDEYFDLLEKETVLTVSGAAGSYAIYLKDYLSLAGLSGELLSVSRAYADSGVGFIIVATMDQVDLFDIVGHWAEADIRRLAQLEIATGYGNNTFRPEKNISRAELLTLVSRVYDLLYPNGLDRESRTYIENMLYSQTSPYADVPPAAWYLEPLLKLEQAGLLPPSMIVYQAAGAYFLPDEGALRSEAALTLAPLFADEKLKPSDTVYIDMYHRDPALQEAVSLLTDAGVLLGNPSGTFAPDDTITRAEICAMLCRALLYFEY